MVQVLSRGQSQLFQEKVGQPSMSGIVELQGVHGEPLCFRDLRFHEAEKVEVGQGVLFG